MKQNLKQNLVTGGGKVGTILADYALEFNGTDEYLQIALPNNIASGTVNDWVSTGSKPAAWAETGTIAWNVTSEVGTTSTYSVSLYRSGGPSTEITIPGLTAGKKYKLRLRYKGLYCYTSYGSVPVNHLSTSEWNAITTIFTAVGTSFYIGSSSGTCYVDYLSIKEDQGFDLNKDQEQILHSKNWDFERTLSTTYASNFSAGVDGFGVYSGNGGVVTGNIDSVAGENDCLKFTANAELQYQIAVKTISQVVGKKYILKCKVYIPSTNAVIKKVGLFTNSDYGIGTNNIEVYDQWVSFEKEGIALNTVPNWFYPLTSGGAAINNGSANGDVFYLKDVQVLEIPNLVSNGTFTGNANGWILGTGWAYGSDKVTKTAGTASAVSQAIQSVSGKRYRISFEVKDYSAGSVYALAYGNQVGTARTANGVYSYDITASTTNTSYGVYCDATFVGSVDNIHIYEIPEWTASGNHTPDISILDKSGTGTQSLLISASGAGDTSNCVTLPSANLESCVSGKKYTLQGEARLDASSLTYGSNLITSWVDSNSNGVIDIANNDNPTYFTDKTPSIKTAGTDGFTGIAQRMELVSGSGLNIWLNGIIPNTRVYKVVFKYRSSKSLNVQQGGNVRATLSANTGNAIETTVYISQTLGNEAGIRFVSATSTVGDYLEIGDITLYEATPITITAQLGTKSVTSSALSIVAGTFTKFVLNFEATASEQSQDLKLWLSGAGSCYVDKLSLTQAYDRIAIVKSKCINHVGGYGGIFHTYGNESNPISDLYYDINGLQLNSRQKDGTNLVQSVTGATLTLNTFYNISQVVNRTGNQQIFVNGTSLTGTATTNLGKMIFTIPIAIASRGAAGLYLNGQISHLQIIRFENISLSSFNSALTGLQYPAGGGAEEVLRLTFQSGVSTTELVRDYSPKGHTVTMVNMNLENRVKVNQSFIPEVSTLQSAFSATYPTVRLMKIQNLILSLKASGVWDKLDVMQVYAAPTSADALVNWKNPGTFDATLVNSPTLEVNKGITGNGTDSYINSGYNPMTVGVNFNDNSCSDGGYFRTNLRVSNTSLFGSRGASSVGSNQIGIRDASDIIINKPGTSKFVPCANISGMLISSRVSNLQYNTYLNGVEIYEQLTEEGDNLTYDGDYYVLAMNDNGTAAKWNTNQIAMFFMGAGLTDTESAAFSTAIETYLDYIGAGVIA